MPVSRALLHFEVLESRFRVLAAFHHLDNAPRLVSSDIVPYDNVAGLNLVVCQMFSLSPRNVPNVRLCASIRISKAICGHRLMFGGVDAQADPAKVEVLADLLSRVAGPSFQSTSRGPERLSSERSTNLAQQKRLNSQAIRAKLTGELAHEDFEAVRESITEETQKIEAAFRRRSRPPWKVGVPDGI